MTSKAKREHHSSHGRKETHGDVHSFPRGMESDNQKRDNLKPPVKDINADIIGKNGQQNVPKIIRSASEQEWNDNKPFYYRSFQPTYTKSRAYISKINSDASPTGSTGETQGHTDMNQRGVQITKEEDTCVNDIIQKPKPKLVRMRLQPMCEYKDDSDRLNNKDRGKGFTSGVKGVERHGKHGIKIANGDHLDQRDEDENMMDRLLMLYTKKLAQIEVKRQKSTVSLLKLPEVDTSEVPRKRFLASIPVELKQANPVALTEGHTQKKSFEYDVPSPNGHIHPKLPDYDDFVTRMTALRRN